MARLGLVAAGGRGRRAFVAPTAFLLAVTIAVVVVQSTRHHSSASSPPSSPLVMSRHPVAVGHMSPFYRVKAGDTLAGIATKTDVSLARLRTLNPSVKPTALFIGEKIRLR